MEKLLNSKNGNFILCVVESICLSDDKPYKKYEIKSIDNADKYAVGICFGWRDGDNQILIRHGMRTVDDTIQEAREYIEVLEEALDFIPHIQRYVEDNPL